MAENLTRKLIREHLLEGTMTPGAEIALRIDQTLTQDATGTLVMLELEAMGLDRVKTELSVQYVDHNLIQEDHKNPDDHRFLMSACRRFGVWYSRAGNGVSHPVHQERFGKPGRTMVGSDSHTPAAGAIGMLAIGAGGLEVALAMAGRPFYLEMPKVWGVELTGELPAWVSAKDVILEMLRRHDVDGGVGYIFEYFGPGLECLSAMDRHVIANMGAELGATTTVFPSDEEVRRFLRRQGREDDWIELLSDRGAEYDRREQIDLAQLEPLIAMPSSPENVVPVREVAGREIGQAYVGSSANPGYRDFAVAAEIVKGRQVHPRVSFDVNPTSRQILENLSRDGHLLSLIHAGARLHQAGCNGCIGMGQAPATDEISLRTVPRNFPGRSGTREDKVCLVSPETAAASALTGVITDPRTLSASWREGGGGSAGRSGGGAGGRKAKSRGRAAGGPPAATEAIKPEIQSDIEYPLDIEYPRVREPEEILLNTALLLAPLPPEESREVELIKGPNIATLPELEPLPDEFELPVLLVVGDDISTDEILPAGTRVLPYRSNIPKISDFAFDAVDRKYPERAREVRDAGGGGHVVIGGRNYGQGSSREHAALAPRTLGLRAVIAKSFARIHWQNLVNFGVLPLAFADPDEYDRLQQGDRLRLTGLDRLADGRELTVENVTRERRFQVRHDLSPRQIELIRAGGVINWIRERV